ncbi:uncharacterized protein [Anser cygnoides]|uniref:uncharacterized protein isoform X2 n=1 Tax=Anser cygnoides TaxID=8845 RepID=UPI0034D19A68
MGKHIEVFVPHMVTTVLEQKGGHWLSPSRMMKYQAILTEQDDVTLKTTNLLNSAVFLGTVPEEGPLEHNCVEIIEHTHASREDLKDVPLERYDWELFTDGSSFVENGTRYAGYAVTTLKTVIEAKPLPPETLTQRAELIALPRALELSEGKMVNIWTDSKYAFGVVHVHGALWKERGLLSSQGANIRYQEEVLNLINAVQKPKQVAIMHCKAHQGGTLKISEGNRLADRAARQIAQEVWNVTALVPLKLNFEVFWCGTDRWHWKILSTTFSQVVWEKISDSGQSQEIYVDTTRDNTGLKAGWKGKAYFEGRKYCEHDFQMLFAPCCHQCGEFIIGRVIKAINNSWHPECFCCDICQQVLADIGFVKNAGRHLCRPCHNREKARGLGKYICQKCHAIIDEQPLIFKNDPYHPDHFNCANCGKELTADARELKGELYCLPCHDKMGVPICGACRRPIEGRVVNAMGKQWHVEHFVCAKCEKPFLGHRHYERKGLAYCETHYNQLFGDVCFHCNRVIEGDVVSALNKAWCVNCFACSTCNTKLTLKNKFVEFDMKPVCKKCYEKFPLELKKRLKKLAETLGRK